MIKSRKVIRCATLIFLPLIKLYCVTRRPINIMGVLKLTASNNVRRNSTGHGLMGNVKILYKISLNYWLSLAYYAEKELSKGN